jgi:hypothetical protein
MSTLTKKALCVGSNYPTTSYRLGECVRDAVEFGYLAQSVYGYDTTLLIDENFSTASSFVMPSRETDMSGYFARVDAGLAAGTKKATIMSAISGILAMPGNMDIVLYFSGHGAYTMDKNKDEADRKDEYYLAGDSLAIVDDELVSLLRSRTSTMGTKNIRIFFDSCHSGSMVDLPYNFTLGRPLQYVSSSALSAARTWPVNVNILSVTACTDSKVTYEDNAGGVVTTKLELFFSTFPNASISELVTYVKNNGLEIIVCGNRDFDKTSQVFGPFAPAAATSVTMTTTGFRRPISITSTTYVSIGSSVVVPPRATQSRSKSNIAANTVRILGAFRRATQNGRY